MADHHHSVISINFAMWVFVMVLVLGFSGNFQAARLDRWESAIRMPVEKDDEARDGDQDVGTRWAVLVAGSSGFGNYRHQVSNFDFIFFLNFCSLEAGLYCSYNFNKINFDGKLVI